MRESLADLSVIDICRGVAGVTEIAAVGGLDEGDRFELDRGCIDWLGALLDPQSEARNAFADSPVECRWPAPERLSGRQTQGLNADECGRVGARPGDRGARNQPAQRGQGHDDKSDSAQSCGRNYRVSASRRPPRQISRIVARIVNDTIGTPPPPCQNSYIDSDCAIRARRTVLRATVADRHRGADPKMRGPHCQRVELDERNPDQRCDLTFWKAEQPSSIMMLWSPPVEIIRSSRVNPPIGIRTASTAIVSNFNTHGDSR